MFSRPSELPHQFIKRIWARVFFCFSLIAVHKIPFVLSSTDALKPGQLVARILKSNPFFSCFGTERCYYAQNFQLRQALKSVAPAALIGNHQLASQNLRPSESLVFERQSVCLASAKDHQSASQKNWCKLLQFIFFSRSTSTSLAASILVHIGKFECTEKIHHNIRPSLSMLTRKVQK